MKTHATRRLHRWPRCRSIWHVWHVSECRRVRWCLQLPWSRGMTKTTAGHGRSPPDVGISCSWSRSPEKSRCWRGKSGSWVRRASHGSEGQQLTRCDLGGWVVTVPRPPVACFSVVGSGRELFSYLDHTLLKQRFVGGDPRLARGEHSGGRVSRRRRFGYFYGTTSTVLLQLQPVSPPLLNAWFQEELGLASVDRPRLLLLLLLSFRLQVGPLHRLWPFFNFLCCRNPRPFSLALWLL
mmetsp:Transcript_30626/g.88995  ORF Transcript_30626/g.88995 Transcript_30626/m.88995 type:complete len:238 (-) Transcript_30626:444-1157(-)